MSQLPSGTLTFLFTEIEDSARLWEKQPEAMQLAAGRHDAILRQAIEAHDGRVFKTVGDAFYAAFANAQQAAAAAAAAQCTLQREASLLRVRMALHTGTADERGGDYFGPTLNRVARLLSAGHGGQILLSHGTAQLVGPHLSAIAAQACPQLHDLGECRFKDLTRPERIFQLSLPGLPADFPPLRSLDSHPTNLPTQPSPLVGRVQELAALRMVQRADVRLVSLTGPGGVGKTRLGLQLAAELLEEFKDGVFFIGLAALDDPRLIVPAINQVLGIQASAEPMLLESLKAHLRDKHVLLVLDNFEHLVEAAPLATELLAASPGLKIVVTSQLALRIYGEHEFPVPPLKAPDLSLLFSVREPVAFFTQYEAVNLFIERARAVKPDFALDRPNILAIAEICARLDGLPLAIELAAARCNWLSPEELLARLGQAHGQARLHLLTDRVVAEGQVTGDRQRTLRATLEWSYSLLDAGEKLLLARLATFAGGCTVEAADVVCNAARDLPVDILDGLESLLDKSMLRHVEGVAGEARFAMLELIREYALEQLAERGASEMQTLQRQHALYYLALAEEAEQALWGGVDQVAWLDRLETEHGNLRAALRWSLEQGQADIGLRLGAALWRFWYWRNYISEGRRWLESVLAQARRTPAVALPSLAQALTAAGNLVSVQGDTQQAIAQFEESLAIWQMLGDKAAIACTLNALGIAVYDQGQHARASALFEESLALQRELGDKLGMAHALNSLGCVLNNQGQHARASALFEESLALFKELDVEWGITYALANLGRAALYQGEHKRALALFKEGLRLCQQLGNKDVIAEYVEGVAGAAGAMGQAERAAWLFGAAEALREAIGAGVPAAERLNYERSLASACAQLDEAAFVKAWLAGRAMTLEQAIACALEL